MLAEKYASASAFGAVLAAARRASSRRRQHSTIEHRHYGVNAQHDDFL
jgi:hypothetical protein